jgi:preprotein translocase subunit YajC
MNFMLHILLAAPAGSSGGGMGFNIMLVLVLVVFYVFMILPQVRKSKQQKKFREALGKGDKIITIGGIHARITDVGETHFIIDSEGTRLRIDKTAVSMEASQPLNKDKEAKK